MKLEKEDIEFEGGFYYDEGKEVSTCVKRNEKTDAIFGIKDLSPYENCYAVYDYGKNNFYLEAIGVHIRLSKTAEKLLFQEFKKQCMEYMQEFAEEEVSARRFSGFLEEFNEEFKAA